MIRFSIDDDLENHGLITQMRKHACQGQDVIGTRHDRDKTCLVPIGEINAKSNAERLNKNRNVLKQERGFVILKWD
jgi:hypothetical protein